MEYKILADFLANETVTLKHNTLKALLQVSCFNQLTKKSPWDILTYYGTCTESHLTPQYQVTICIWL